MEDYPYSSSSTYAYISEPVEFRQLEGRAIDFRKTFDLRGQGGDEVLQLYLRKANLSDDLTRLPAIMRRAYIYDIVRSNKEPGYWVPPSMQVSSDVFAHPPPAVRPPPSYSDNVSLNFSLGSMKSSSSNNSLDRYAGAPSAVALAGPSFATSVVVSSKGSKYEISGPVNFQHVSGDVTRDRTRNAFDLSADSNDNVLRKYMIERGITEADISGMRRQDVIKKIVHSNFTWMPSKGDLQGKPPVLEKKGQERPLLYATISTNNQITPPPSPPPVMDLKPAPAPSFSNYASLTSRFVDISDMDLPGSEPAPALVRQQEPESYMVPVQVQQPNRFKVPPPPSAVTANNTHSYPTAIDTRQVRPAPPPKVSNETYATIAPQRKAGTMRAPPPAPPKPTIVPNTNSTASLASVSSVQHAPVAKPPPPAPPVKPSSGARPPAASVSYVPPPPTIQVQSNRFKASGPSPPIQVQHNKLYAPAPPPMLVQSNKTYTGAPPPMQSNKSHAPVPPPPPPASLGGIPPPPPPMPVAAFAGGAPPPPPPPSAGGPPPPPPIQKSLPKAAPAASSGGDDRDAFLDSIRKGVALKKVDQKAATISGVKPRAERKPPTMDFMSELKLGITLRRVKNPADNPFSEESQA